MDSVLLRVRHHIKLYTNFPIKVIQLEIFENIL